MLQNKKNFILKQNSIFNLTFLKERQETKN
jgi:hypothetical protein